MLDDKNTNRKTTYEDLLYLPHPDSARHPRMSLYQRAAQFSPFAALTGFEGAVRETARITEARRELTESEKQALDEILQNIRAEEYSGEIEVCYFQPDEKKDGGSYVSVRGRIRKILEFEKEIIFTNGMRIPMGEILKISEIL